ncbi:MAG TPA: hypothetical protein VID29_02745 [Solirubrobacteraceae bacterium]|jgi:hypothetical protein
MCLGTSWTDVAGHGCDKLVQLKELRAEQCRRFAEEHRETLRGLGK